MSADNKLAPFNPTCAEAVAVALSMAQLTPVDTLLDVGCGDGRLLVEVCGETILCVVLLLCKWTLTASHCRCWTHNRQPASSR